MPRTIQEIVDHADELARQFEESEPTGPARATELGELYRAVTARGAAERTVADRVHAAHRAGYTWTVIGTMLGTSGEAARQRYGQPAKPRTSAGTAARAAVKKVTRLHARNAAQPARRRAGTSASPMAAKATKGAASKKG